MNNLLLQLEAVLFAYGKRVTESELQRVLKLSDAKLKEALTSLAKEYEKKESALHLVNEHPYWKLTVKDTYMDLVKNIVTKTELDRPTMETLAVIAFKYPVLQSDVIEVRNATAYEHISTLVDLGYVVKEKKGRSFALKLTPKFFEYFDLPEKKMKEMFSEYEEIAQTITEKEKEAHQLQEKAEEQKKVIKAKSENKQLTNFEEN